MLYLSGEEKEEALFYLGFTARIAKQSSCLRSKCGSIIVKDKTIIGEGFNSPPKNLPLDICLKDTLSEDFPSDKTCCVHAEQRAIMNALEKYPNHLWGSRLYFIRLDLNNEILKAGKPYCTICSKMVLDKNIREFVLWHEEGICVYDTEEYNRLSFEFKKE